MAGNGHETRYLYFRDRFDHQHHVRIQDNDFWLADRNLNSIGNVLKIPMGITGIGSTSGSQLSHFGSSKYNLRLAVKNRKPTGNDNEIYQNGYFRACLDQRHAKIHHGDFRTANKNQKSTGNTLNPLPLMVA